MLLKIENWVIFALAQDSLAELEGQHVSKKQTNF